ncbi:DUF1573 domain-containing protein [Chitinophagaceae bacterium MMS25-I14]
MTCFFKRLILPLLLCTAAAKAQPPAILFIGSKYCYGSSVKKNDEKRSTFRILNNGGTALRIDSFICTGDEQHAAQIHIVPAKAKLKPGDTATFTALWKISGEPGDFSINIHPISNAANSNVTDASHKKELTINGYLLPDTPVHGAIMYFPEGLVHDCGLVPEGPNLEVPYHFKNVGKEPLIITRAASSCGCLVATWPKEPIMPGKTGAITLFYSTAGRPGQFIKTVNIACNDATIPANGMITLTIKGDVQQAPPESSKLK